MWGVFIWIRRRQRPGGVFVWEWVRDMSVSSTIDLETDDATVGMDRTIFDLSTASYGFVGEAANDQSGYGVAGAGDVDGDGPRGLPIGAVSHDAGGSSFENRGKASWMLSSHITAQTAETAGATYA